MSRYRKKPIVIEAWQFVDGVNAGAAPAWLLSALITGRIVANATERCLNVQTLEGTMRADVGDWIINGVKGEIYPCKPDIFDATYEPVPEVRVARP